MTNSMPDRQIAEKNKCLQKWRKRQCETNGPGTLFYQVDTNALNPREKV